MSVLPGLVLAAVLFALVGWPTLAIGLSAWDEPEGFGIQAVSRPLSLARESLKLTALTECLALPLGVLLAWLLFRVEVRGRRALLTLVVLLLFIPLPLQALAWLGSLGNQGRSQVFGGRPILVGHFGAAFVHAGAALPWVVLGVGAGLRAVEVELEESALLHLGRAWVAWHVSLRRALGAILGVAIAAAVLTAGEMTVTDLLNLRTYAEEAYTIGQQGLGLGRLALAATWPQVVLVGALVFAASSLLLRADPARVASAWSAARDRPRLPGHPLLTLGLWLGLGSLLVLPIYGLVWRAGRVGRGLVAGRGAEWSFAGLAGTLSRAWGDLSAADLTRLTLPQSVALAAAGASISVALAWALAWKASRSRAWGVAAACLASLLLAAPGPVVGIALKLAYARSGFLQRTPALMVMGYVARTLPFALLILWPLIRTIPRDDLDAAAIDGLGPLRRVGRVAIPQTRWGIAAAWGLCLSLALAELPATYLLRAPRSDPVALYVWSMLHNGVESQLAGVGLLLLGVAALIGIPATLALRFAYRSASRGA
jgi:iron(III) transport system permease protein